MLTPTKNQV